MSDDAVDDAETLFRCVAGDPDKGQWAVDENGVRRVSSAAFQDPHFKPSVDRANRCNNDPLWTRRGERDGVARLAATGIRAIEPALVSDLDEKGHVKQERKVDVVPDAVELDVERGVRANPAHAVIVTTPQITKNNKAWGRVRVALARVATDGGWATVPTSAE